EQLVLEQHLLDDLVWATHVIRAAQRRRRIELLARYRGPTALPPDLAHRRRIRGEVRIRRLASRIGDKTVRIDAQTRLRRIVTSVLPRLAVQIDQRHESLRQATDDRQ